MYSAHLFQAQFQAHLQDEQAIRLTGQRYRDLVLARGGTVQPLSMMRGFLQGEEPLHYAPFLHRVSGRDVFAA